MEQEQRERQIALEKSTQEYLKMKKEIEDLNAMKSGLVREINLQLIDARAQADKIMAEAKEAARFLIDTSEKAHSEAVAFDQKTRQDAEGILHIAKTAAQEVKTSQDKLVQDQADFNKEKTDTTAELQGRDEATAKAELRSNERQQDLDNRERIVLADETRISEGLAELRRGEDILLAKNNKLTTDQAALDNNIANYLKDKEALDAQVKLNNQLLVDIKATQEKVTTDLKVGQELKAEVDKQNLAIAEQKKTLNAQFDLLTQNQRELEEKNTALDERFQLLAIRNKDIEEKIKILNELRVKK